MGVSPICVSGNMTCRRWLTLRRSWLPETSIAHAVSSCSTFGFAPSITLFLPALSLPNQARISWASASASAPVGLAAIRAASVCVESLSAPMAGCARASVASTETSSGVRVIIWVSFA